MPLVPKNAGTGAAALAAIVAQAKAAAAANAIRQVAATVAAPAPVQRTMTQNVAKAPATYYGPTAFGPVQSGGNVVVNAPPVNGGQASEFYTPLPRTTERNSSALYGYSAQPTVVYQPPVNGGQASEFYTPPRPYYGPTAFGPSGAMGPPAPLQNQPRIMPGGPQSSNGADSPYGTQVLQTDPGPQRSPDPTAYYPVP